MTHVFNRWKWMDQRSLKPWVRLEEGVNFIPFQSHKVRLVHLDATLSWFRCPQKLDVMAIADGDFSPVSQVVQLAWSEPNVLKGLYSSRMPSFAVNLTAKTCVNISQKATLLVVERLSTPSESIPSISSNRQGSMTHRRFGTAYSPSVVSKVRSDWGRVIFVKTKASGIASAPPLANRCNFSKTAIEWRFLDFPDSNKSIEELWFPRRERARKTVAVLNLTNSKLAHFQVLFPYSWTIPSVERTLPVVDDRPPSRKTQPIRYLREPTRSAPERYDLRRSVSQQARHCFCHKY